MNLNSIRQYRNDKSSWGNLLFRPSRDSTQCVNSDTREDLARKLVLNHKDTDRLLVKCILENELEAIKETNSGSFYTIILSSYMLALFRNEEDIHLIYKSKYCTVDIDSEIELFLIFWPLKEKTATYLERNHPEIYKHLSDYFRSCGKDIHKFDLSNITKWLKDYEDYILGEYV